MEEDGEHTLTMTEGDAGSDMPRPLSDMRSIGERPWALSCDSSCLRSSFAARFAKKDNVLAHVLALLALLIVFTTA